MFGHKKNRTRDIPVENTAATEPTGKKKHKKTHPIRHGVFLSILYFVAYYAASIGILLLVGPFLGGLADLVIEVFIQLPLCRMIYKKTRPAFHAGEPVRLSRKQVLAILATHMFLFILPVKLAHKHLFLAIGGNDGSVLGLITVCLVAPIAEEVIFRGAFFTMSRKHLPFWPAAIVTSVLFGLLHFGNAGNMIDSALFGILACMLYEATGTIRYGVYIHYLFNNLGLVMTLFGMAIPAAAAQPLYIAAVAIQFVSYTRYGRIVDRIRA